MHKITKFSLIFIAINSVIVNAQTGVTIGRANETIKECDGLLNKVIDSRKNIEQLKDPGLFGSSAKKEVYKNKSVHLKAFDGALKDLIGISNEKIQIRIAKDDLARGDQLASYIRRCRDSATTILALATYATTGTWPNADFQKRIIESWINQEKCGKLKCP